MFGYHFDYELPKLGSSLDRSHAGSKNETHVKGIVFDDETGRSSYYYDLSTRHPVGARLKRIIDVSFSLALIVLLAPILLLVALAIRLTSAGPILFRQRRIGFRGNPFEMYKFRTMVNGADKLESGNGTAFVKPAKDDPRITRVGRFLRKHSLDELPQLFNVVEGTMSLIGPRPLRDVDVASLDQCSTIRRFATPPGISGLWQVSGRSECVGAEGLALDREYVDRWSPSLDTDILLRTIGVVLTGRGAV